MIKGIEFDFGAKKLIVPPLSLGFLESMQDRLERFKGGTDVESIGIVVDAATAALRRNYPELKREDVGELIDLGNMLEVFGALMDVSGALRKQKESEAGEAAAPSTGAASTQD